MFRNIPKYILVFFACFWICASCRVWAGDWSVSTGVILKGEYNDNVLFSREDEQEDFITKLSPSVEAIGRTERTTFDLKSSLTGEKYLDNDDYDTLLTDNNATLEHYWTEVFSTRLSGGFRKDKTLETEIERAGLTGVRKDRYEYSLDMGTTYTFTDRFTLDLSGGAVFRRYPDGPYPDLDLWQVNANPTWAVTEVDVLGLVINYYSADYKDVGTISTLSNSLYWRRDLSENTYVVFGVGFRKTWTEYDIPKLTGYILSIDPATHNLFLIPVLVKEKKRSEDSGFIFNFSLNNDWTERFSTVINAGREQYNSVDARSTERTYIRSTLIYRLTERTSLNCNIGYDRNEESGTYDENTDFIRFGPSLSYKCTEHLTLNVGGLYEYEKEETDYREFSLNRTRCWFSISYRWPRILANH